MNRVRRQLMRPSATATPLAVAAPHLSASYSLHGQLTNEVQNGVSIARSYDAFSRPTGYYLNPVNPVNPVQVSYSYDGLGHFASVSASGIFNSQFSTFNYSYLPGTDLVTGYTSGDFSRSVVYEPQRDLIAAVTNSFTPAGETFNLQLSTFNYSNDAAGRRVSRRDTFDRATTENTFGYNARSEVVSALMGTNSYGYAYDPIGNRLSASLNFETNAYTANCLNQYTSISNLCVSVPPCEPSCDADGNMTADERGWHYLWNGENRMICASNDEVVVTYAYDHRGRMVRKNISRRDSEPQSIAFLWDGWNIIRETATDHSTLQPFNLSTDYVWGLDIDGTLQGAGGVGGLLAVSVADTQHPTPNTQLYLPTYDANGNITEYVATNGAVVAHYEYSPFGEPTVSSGELASAFTHQFSTKPYCAVTGFSEYQMRKYRPDIGRWMSRDPIEDSSMINLYLQVGNNVINKIDYLGELDIPNLGLCVSKCGLTSAISDWLTEIFEVAAFCGDIMRECQANFNDYFSGTGHIPSPLPPPKAIPIPDIPRGTPKFQKIANCLSKCLGLDNIGVQIVSSLIVSQPSKESDIFACNTSSKRLEFSFCYDLKLTLAPFNITIFSKQDCNSGSCGSPTYVPCCACRGW